MTERIADGVTAIENHDGTVDYVNICATHLRASRRYIDAAGARQSWICPACDMHWTQAEDHRRYQDVMGALKGGR